MNSKLKTNKVLVLIVEILIIILLVFLMVGNLDGKVYAENINIVTEEKIYCNADINDNFEPNSVIVVLDKKVGGINKRQKKTLFKGIEIESIRDLTFVNETGKGKKYLNSEEFKQILEIKLPIESKENVLEVIKKIEQIDGVFCAEPNYYGEEAALPENSTGTKYQELWGIHDSSYGINAPLAWDVSTGSEDVKVAVIDSGIAAHNNLNANLAIGWNFVDNNNNTNDVNGHGTHIAGIIGATPNTMNGVVGVNWNVTLVPLKITNDKVWLDTLAIEAINWARNNDIPIINFSGWKFKSNALSSVIAGYDGLFVTIAGNNSSDNDIEPNYPSDYSHGQAFSDRVISVGAINSNGEIAGFSNYGATSVDIFAPGDNILSTFPIDKCNSNLNDTYNTPSGIKRWCEVKWSDEKNQWVSNGTTHVETGYHFMSGTSMAAPHVTGVAALMMSFNPYLTAEEIKDIIINNDTNLDAVSNSCVSGGILNAYKALKATYKPEEIFTDFGYEGSTYSWKGVVEMDYDADNKMEDGMLIVEDYSSLSFEVKTISSENAWLVTNGEIRFELEQSDGQIIQTNICTVTVDLLNNVTFTGNTFSINTSQLGTGTYFLKMYCTFNRGEWSSETTHSYAFGVNRPITVMEDFGYLSSWYKWKGNVKLSSDHLYLFNNSNSLTLMGDVDLTFTIGTSFAFNAVQEMTGTVTIELQDSSGNIIPINGNNKHTSNIRVGLASNVSISNSSFTINISDFADDTYTLRLDCRMTRGGTTYNNSDTYSFSVRNEMCIAQGTMITLADGTQKAVEDLIGDEQLLVWNMLTGQFDTAPILFIDSDEQRFYQVVNLYFSDGTSVKVIGEHAFWNKDLNEYVFLRKDADQYIGDSFIKQTTNDNGEMVSSEVLLIDVVVTMEHTTAWSPVTYGHLCYYVNGMLSMPGATEGLINIFEVDPDAMRYDEEAMNQDIATYGLFTYEEFNALIPVPEEIFEAFNGQYLKVSIGKGYTSIEELAQLIERYSQFF